MYNLKQQTIGPSVHVIESDTKITEREREREQCEKTKFDCDFDAKLYGLDCMCMTTNCILTAMGDI